MKLKLPLSLALLIFFMVACLPQNEQLAYHTETVSPQVEALTPIQTEYSESTVDRQATKAAVRETANWEATQTEAVQANLRNATRTAKALTPSPKPNTLTPSATLVPPTFTPTPLPTFNMSEIVTVTPAFPSACPEPDPDLEPPDFDVLDENNEMDYVHYLEYFNQGGTLEAIPANWQPSYIIDLTNDGIDDYVIKEYDFYGGAHVLSCKDGLYQVFGLYPRGGTRVIVIEDANANNIPEIVLLMHEGTLGGQGYQIYEWNGNVFQNRVAPHYPDMPEEEADIYGYSFKQLSYQDVDNNGTLEMFWEWGLPVAWSVYTDGLPWRERISIYMWNGKHFARHKNEYSPPEYRFQAVQDGDTALYFHDYEKAAEFYWAVINDESLSWWSLERRQHEQSLPPNVIKPTPIASLEPDPNEYPNLVGYAYYRIMQLNILRGQDEEAQIVFETLREKYPKGSPGFAYVELATVFWETYQNSHKIDLACIQAIQYAEEHQDDILYYLGNSPVNEHYRFGDQSRYYTPDSICSFE